MRSIVPPLVGGMACCALPSFASAEPLTPVRFLHVSGPLIAPLDKRPPFDILK